MSFSALADALHWSMSSAKKFFGGSDNAISVSVPSRIGLALSGGLLILAGLWLLEVESALLFALITFYLVLSRLLMIGYSTDTIVGTYMGVLKVLQFQSPYPFSIKPFLDQFGFSP